MGFLSHPINASHCGTTHMAVLVLLAAAAGAGIITADPVATIADGLDLLGSRTRVGRRWAFDRRRHGRGLVNGGADLPERLLEPLFLFHAKDRFGDLVLDALPHEVEFFHPLPLVLGLGIDLGIADQANA